jgi:hypothetical protein
MDHTVLIAHAADKFSEVALDEATNTHIAVHDKPTLVQLLAFESAVVDRLLVYFLDALSFTLLVADLVKNVTLFIHSETNKTLGVVRDDFSDYVAISIFNLATLDNTEVLKSSKLTF